MLAAYKLVVEEADETEGDVILLSDYLEKYGFDKVRGVSSYQEILNKRGKNGSSQYRRV
jgi:hypothetical protein